ncbi:MAG: hypothetical protein KQH53_00135 [Desulfarculaceae bacterium]|nr:hypothetical protein [Desulfarculaceae bacterium]
MLRILLVTPTPGSLATLSAALLAEPEVTVSWETTGEAALENAAAKDYDLVVLDEQVRDMSPWSFLNRLVLVNAFVNTAVVSQRAEEDFHEVYEGLGVLAQMPPQPGRAEAEKLISKLKEVSAAAG